mmetsp:Transcript_19149/g.29168  ORF Transcript_19149/g.29168 Transcript_19149/m.29168 type:complete len:368 (-) Transcript_19149:37-1140(-)
MRLGGRLQLSALLASSTFSTIASAFVVTTTGKAPVLSFTKLTRRRFLSQRNMSSSSSSSSNKPKVALLQFAVSSNKQENHQRASEYLKRASTSGCQLAVLPEIWNGPYATAAFEEYAEVLPCVGAEDSMDASPSAQLLQQHAIDYQMWIVGGSISEKVNDGTSTKLYNTCLVFDPKGKVVAKHRKVHLFDIDVPGGITFRESDTLSPGESLTVFDGGEDFGMVGIGICYDIRFPEYSQLLTQKYNCNLLIFPGAFNLTTGPAHWELLQRARAVDNQCYVLTASPARVVDDDGENESNNKRKYPHYTAWGHSTVVAPWGDVVATTDESESLVVTELDLTKVSSMRQSIPTFQQKRSDLYVLEEPSSSS